jgi:hydroxymethylglutaryl-CoA lyase
MFMKDLVIHDVGMRDGLQMERKIVPMDIKINWIEKLIESGVKFIQVGSFVNPDKMPQMKDTADIFSHFKQSNIVQDVCLSALILNEKGYERAVSAGVDMICMGVSASDTHSMKNTGMTTDEATDRIINIAKEAIKSKQNIQVSVQSAFGCGFEGAIDENKVYSIVEKYLDAGITKISLADTAGHANPAQVKRMFNKINTLNGDIQIACHFHNTYGMGLVNTLTAIESGATYIETAFGGLGGCPFTKLASGNVSTEDFVHMMQNMDKLTGIKLGSLISLSEEASAFFDKQLPGYVYKAGQINH